MRRLPPARDTVVCRVRAQCLRSADPRVSPGRSGSTVLGAEPLPRSGAASCTGGQGTSPSGSRASAGTRPRRGTRRVAGAGPAPDTCTLAEPAGRGAAARWRPGPAVRADRGPIAGQLPGSAVSASLVGSPRFGRSVGARARPQSTRSGECCAATAPRGERAGRPGRRRFDDRCHGLRVHPGSHCRRNTPGWRIRDVCRVNPGNLREQWRTFDPRTSVACTHPIREFGGGPRTSRAGRLDPTWPAPFHPAACDDKCAAESGRYA